MAQGVVYGDYYLLGRLAQGGMAEVFLAKSLHGAYEGKLLALKRTLSQYSAEEDFISMFEDEARIASGLKHANICKILDHGSLGDQRYIVMEFIHGKDLKVVAHRAAQRKERIPQPYVAYTLAKMAEALHAAHTKRNDKGELERIVHRDVSPQNILISYDGVPKLIDFGIAKAKDRLAKTQAGVVKGKFAYMSPEQAIGGEVDWRTDIFALGVVVYELLTGQLPFKGSSDFSTLKKIAKAEYAPPNTDKIPSRLMKVIQKSLTRSPDDRYATAEEMADDLDRFLVDLNRTIRPASLSSYMRKLFREDYIREASRMKKYLDLEMPTVEVGAIAPEDTKDRTTRRAAALAEEARGQSDVDKEDEEEETTRITSSPELAAGFDAEDDDEIDSEVTGLAELLEPEEADGLDFDTLDIDDGGAVALDPGEFDEPTRNVEVPDEFSFTESTREVSAPDEAELAAKPAQIIDPDDEDDETREVDVIDDDLDLDSPTLPISDDDRQAIIDRGIEPEPGPDPSDVALPEPEPEPEPPPKKPKTDPPKRRATTGRNKTSARDKKKRRKTRTTKGGSTRKRKRKAAFSGGEIATLGFVGVIAFSFVIFIYYVMNNGVPAFASGLKPTIEKITGELPRHPSEKKAPPKDAKKGSAPTPSKKTAKSK